MTKFLELKSLINYDRVKRIFAQKDAEALNDLEAEKGGEPLRYKFFDGGAAYDLNIFGVRNENRNQDNDAFDDVIGVAYLNELGQPRLELYQATTDPGRPHLTSPTFPAAIAEGTAILVPGQYRSAYQLGYHGSGAWRHTALRQVGKVKIYRDGDRDTELDMEPDNTSEGWFGINIHAASLWRNVEKIGRYSAGCQVIHSPEDYKMFIHLCQMQEAYDLGDRFTYTLLEESDFEAAALAEAHGE